MTLSVVGPRLHPSRTTTSYERRGELGLTVRRAAPDRLGHQVLAGTAKGALVIKVHEDEERGASAARSRSCGLVAKGAPMNWR